MSNADEIEPSGRVVPKVKTGETVVVGCKIPNGMVLHLDRMVEFKQPILGGGVEKGEIAQRLPDTFRLNGNSVALNPDGRVTEIDHRIIGGYGITTGIPRDFWDRWLAANKDADYVRNRLVFAVGDEERAVSVAREQAEIRSGLEPIDRNNPGAAAPDLRRIQQGTTTAA